MVLGKKKSYACMLSGALLAESPGATAVTLVCEPVWPSGKALTSLLFYDEVTIVHIYNSTMVKVRLFVGGVVFVVLFS